MFWYFLKIQFYPVFCTMLWNPPQDIGSSCNHTLYAKFFNTYCKYNCNFSLGVLRNQLHGASVFHERQTITWLVKNYRTPLFIVPKDSLPCSQDLPPESDESSPNSYLRSIFILVLCCILNLGLPSGLVPSVLLKFCVHLIFPCMLHIMPM